MERIKELTVWDLECTHEPDGYNMRSVPKPTQENMEKLVNVINDLQNTVNVLMEAHNLIDTEDTQKL